MSSRTIKNDDENEFEKNRMQINGFKKPALTNEYYPKELKRAALGELGNRVATRAASKENATVKSDYKHVKPRVDCHWKVKNETEKITDVMLKRTESTRRNNPSTKPIEGVKAKIEPPKIRIIRPSIDESSYRCQTVSSKPAVTVSNKPTVSIKCLAVSPKIRSHSQKLLCQIEDIDEEKGNLFLVNDYAHDVYNYLFELENHNIVSEKYLENHAEITPTMRTILIDWLSETHTQFQLVMETYFLTVALVDAYLQNHPETKRKSLQLVGCTAMFVAAKYEEVYAPDIKEFVYITDRTYVEKQICEMERSILNAVNFQLGQPLSIQFLRRFSKAVNADAVQHLMGKYFIELASIEYSMVHLKKSLIAAASLYLATHIHKRAPTFNPNLWTSTIEFYSTYNATELQPVALQIITLIKNAPRGPKNKYYAIYSKYSKQKNEEISKKLNEPKARELLDLLLRRNC